MLIKKGKGFKWTLEDEQNLRKNYLIKTKEELLIIFKGRTWKAIRDKANKFKLKRSNDYKKIDKTELYKVENGITYKKCKCCGRYLPFELKYFPKDLSCDDNFRGICKECKGEKFSITNHIKWTDEEIKLLKEVYETSTLAELSDEFFPNRRREYIDYKAIELGLHKTKETMNRIYIERFTVESNLKISNTRKIDGIFKGKANPMYGSHRVGILNPHWKGESVNEGLRMRSSYDYKEWHKEVLKRDNYICQCCGIKTNKLEVHHLNNFAEFKDERLDLDNGITLCKSCHNSTIEGSFHNTYGTCHNTKEQFEEYKKYRNEINKEVS